MHSSPWHSSKRPGSRLAAISGFEHSTAGRPAGQARFRRGHSRRYLKMVQSLKAGCAGRTGIVTCWLNRTRRQWQYDIQPDHEVTTLTEAASLLGIEIASSDG